MGRSPTVRRDFLYAMGGFIVVTRHPIYATDLCTVQTSMEMLTLGVDQALTLIQTHRRDPLVITLTRCRVRWPHLDRQPRKLTIIIPTYQETHLTQAIPTHFLVIQTQLVLTPTQYQIRLWLIVCHRILKLITS